jgi:hypothetical protein
MQLTGAALARLEALTPPGHEARIDLSITDDWPLAQAFVIISAIQSGKPQGREGGSPISGKPGITDYSMD